MLKAIGAILLAAGGAYWGIRMDWELKQQEQTTRDLADGLAALERELEIGGRSLCVMLDQMATGCRGEANALFARCAEEMKLRDRKEFSAIWQTEVQKEDISQEGKQILLNLEGVLGRCNGKTQRENLAAAQKGLLRLAEEMRCERKGKGKLYQMTGVSGGIFLAILLL